MPLMTGSLPPNLVTAVKGHEKEMLKTLQNCRDALAGNGAGANTILQRWFGDSSAAFRKDMKEKVAKMRSVLNARDIECKTDILGGSATNNAESYSYTSGLFEKGDTLNRMTDADTHIKIGPNFPLLPKTASGVPSGWTGQDQLETMLHELSHFVIGTADEKLDDGSTTAYGGAAARLLVTQSVDRAKNNAENWGFFIEEFR